MKLIWIISLAVWLQIGHLNCDTDGSGLGIYDDYEIGDHGDDYEISDHGDDYSLSLRDLFNWDLFEFDNSTEANTTEATIEASSSEVEAVNTTFGNATTEEAVVNATASTPLATELKEASNNSVFSSDSTMPTIDNSSVTEEDNPTSVSTDDYPEESSPLNNSPENGEDVTVPTPTGDYSGESTTMEEEISSKKDLTKYLEDNPLANQISSENYPNPYGNNYKEIWNLKVSNGAGIEVIVHEMDCDPQSDYLFIRGGNENDTDNDGQILTGFFKETTTIIIPHVTELYLEFVSTKNSSQEHKGFMLTYAPYGVAMTTTPDPTPEPTVPTESLQSIRRELSVREDLHNSTSHWNQVRIYLATATNTYINKYNLSVYDCRAEDVVYLMIQKCPDTWPKSRDCVTVEFAIPLRPIVIVTEDNLDLSRGLFEITTTEAPEAEYELSLENLERMWIEFAVVELSQHGIEVYLMPESSSVLAIWITISLAIIAAFIFVLYSIWKIDFFRDYRRMSDLAEDKANIHSKDSEYDISMFPSPHQVVPNIFPNGNDGDGGIDNMAAQFDAMFSRYDPPDFEKIYDTAITFDADPVNNFTFTPSEMNDFNDLNTTNPFRPSNSGSDKTMYVKGTNMEESMS